MLNPLDAICNVKRNDAICVSNLKNAKKQDRSILIEKPDVKIFLPYRFHFYKVGDVFKPNTYNRFLGKFLARNFRKATLSQLGQEKIFETFK